jgi:hypothetical protein
MSLGDFEKELLGSASTDGPTAEGRAANRAAVMKAAGFVGTTKLSTSDATATKVAHAGASLASVKPLLFAGAIIAALGAVAAGLALRGSDAPPELGSPPMASIHTAAPTPIETSAPPPVESAAPIASSPPPAVSMRVPPPNKPALDPLAEETRLLDEARACADKKDLGCASARLREHQRKFPRGALADEAALVGIDVARAAGDVDQARKLASDLLRANPTGPYARRARVILDDLRDE